MRSRARLTFNVSAKNETMSSYQEVAEQFARLLIDAKWEEARGLLASNLRKETTAQDLKDAVEAMTQYVERPVTTAEVMNTLDDWPDKEEGDVGWAYVAMAGDGFSEAVTVIVHSEDSRLLIRSLEWGRP